MYLWYLDMFGFCTHFFLKTVIKLKTYFCLLFIYKSGPFTAMKIQQFQHKNVIQFSYMRAPSAIYRRPPQPIGKQRKAPALSKPETSAETATATT